MTTLLLYDDLFRRHETGYHPESPQRLDAILNRLHADGLGARCRRVTPRDATRDELARIHAENYIDRIRAMAAAGGGMLDVDTVVSPATWAAAVRAAGAALDGVDRIMNGEARNGLALVRPPGHHARPDGGMGFCIFNSIAVAARHLLDVHGLRRVLIVDWDAHHGNGTQEAFYAEPRVFYFSIHAYPFYPGSGSADERGVGAGEGSTRNVPLPLDVGRETFLAAFHGGLDEVLDKFEPEFVLVSAGFDAADGDPLADMGLYPEDFADMTRRVCAAAAGGGKGRVLSLLEGGYDLHALPLCVEAHLKVMIEDGEKPR